MLIAKENTFRNNYKIKLMTANKKLLRKSNLINKKIFISFKGYQKSLE